MTYRCLGYHWHKCWLKGNYVSATPLGQWFENRSHVQHTHRGLHHVSLCLCYPHKELYTITGKTRVWLLSNYTQATGGIANSKSLRRVSLEVFLDPMSLSVRMWYSDLRRDPTRSQSSNYHETNTASSAVMFLIPGWQNHTDNTLCVTAVPPQTM